MAGSKNAAHFISEGGQLFDAGRHEDAADSFAIALAHDNSIADAWLGYGRAMLAQSHFDSAIQHLEKAVALEPQCVIGWVELARALKQSGRTSSAAVAYERAIESAPDDPAAYVNLALLCLAQLGEPARAEELLRRAIAIAPTTAEAQVNLGLAMQDQGRLADALGHFQKLVARDPQNVEYRWHHACARLAAADFAHGWDDYEARKARKGWWRSPPPYPEWTGKPLTRGPLLVYAEQGLGDEIMFASCLPEVLRGGNGCILECDRRLSGLYMRSFPAAKVHGVDRSQDDWGWLRQFPDIEAQCAIGSLPRFFRRSQDAFPDAAYLVADPARVARWHAALGAADVPRVGIAWRGGTRQTRGELRSTPLQDWIRLLTSSGARFYPLQAVTEVERTEAPEAVRRLETAPQIANIEDLAAAIASLDLVITVQGTPVHLAGALGRPVWVLLPSSAEWRYLASGDRMPWYGSARLFRQPAPHAWSAVFDSVRTALNGQC